MHSKKSRDIFSQIIETNPTKLDHRQVLKAACLETPLGPMLAISDEKSLFLLEFIDRKEVEREVERLRQRTKSTITPGVTPVIDSIEKELSQYFDGTLTTFKTPLADFGSPFQKTVWNALRKIPIGETRSYADIAKFIERPTAFRAVAQANGSNQIVIVIPCHRVINTNGDLGGYSSGLSRKKWLLNHEQSKVLT